MTVRFIVGLVVLASWIAVPGAGRAQVVLDTTVTLPRVTVTATRTQTDVVSVPVRVTVLGTEALRRTAATSVGGLLRERGGAFVRAYGPGGLASLSLRGTGASQTLVLLDGHRLTDPQLGQLDLSLLPTLLLSSVEVMHGSASPLYGSDGLGGAVHLHTWEPGAAPEAEVLAAAGAYGERLVGTRLQGTRGRLGAVAVAEVETAEGDFPYWSEALFPAREVRRANADRQRRSLYGALGYDAAPGGRRARLAAWYADAERGLPSVGTGTSGERQWDEHLRLWADAEQRLGAGRLRVGGLVQHTALRYRNETLALDETGRTRRYAAEAELTQAVGARTLLGAGVSGSLATARHPSLTGAAREVQGAVFTHATAQVGPVLLYPALRVDVYAPEGEVRQVVPSPRLGVNLQAGAWRWKASVGRSFRALTFNDRFWRGAGARGRSDLHPEVGWSLDAGGRRALGPGVAEASVYLLLVRDQIVWLPTDGLWQPENRSRVRTRGLEVSYRAAVQPTRRTRLDASAFYTLTDARDRSAAGTPAFGRPLRYVPRHQLKLRLDAERGPLGAGLSTRYVGARPVRSDGSLDLDPYLIADAQVRARTAWTWAEATLSLHVENLLGTDYEVIQGYPMPPRHLRVRLRLTTR